MIRLKYKTGKSQPVLTLSHDILVFFQNGFDGSSYAKQLGLNHLSTINSQTVIFSANDARTASNARELLNRMQGVQAAHSLYLNGAGQAKSFTPNDPFFFPGANPSVGGPGSTANSLYPGQWHLLNNFPAVAGSGGNNPAISINVSPAWQNNFTGLGITIGIVEDAVEVSHPDLVANNTPVASLNRQFSNTGAVIDNDPTPPSNSFVGDHGTAVAGVAAARGGNGIGVTGVAPFAHFVGIRTTDYNVPAVVASYAHANGAGPNAIQIKNHSYGPSTPFDSSWSATVTAIENSAKAGTVNVIAIGNDRGNINEDGNKAYPQNTPYSLNIGALGNDGFFAFYSTYGANMIATAPSNTQSIFPGITTTDRSGTEGYNFDGTSNYASASGSGTGLNYTNEFGGTSSAAPLASGAIAVALSANPALVQSNLTTNQNTTRIIKHLLVRTSTKVDPTDSSVSSDSGWRANSAGFEFNQNYGFGLINTNALTQLALQNPTLSPLTVYDTGTISVNQAVPDNNIFGITQSVVVNVPAQDLQPIEEVIVRLSISHSYRGDLAAFVTSPSGYRSRLFASALDDNGSNIEWQFLSNAFWGENPNGVWSVLIADYTALDVGTWNNFGIEIRMGQIFLPVPEPAFVLLSAGMVAFAIRRFRRNSKNQSV